MCRDPLAGHQRKLCCRDAVNLQPTPCSDRGDPASVIAAGLHDACMRDASEPAETQHDGKHGQRGWTARRPRTACRTIARRAQTVLLGTSCIVGGRVAVGQAVHKRAANYRAAICSAIGPAIRLLPRKLSFWVWKGRNRACRPPFLKSTTAEPSPSASGRGGTGLSRTLQPRASSRGVHGELRLLRGPFNPTQSAGCPWTER